MSQKPQLNRRWCSSGHHPFAKACGCSQAAGRVTSPRTTMAPNVVEGYPLLGDWHAQGRCRDGDTHFEGDHNDQLNGDRKKRARRVCDRCPVRTQCLIDALRTPRDMDFHMRGGFSAAERDEIRRGQVVLA